MRRERASITVLRIHVSFCLSSTVYRSVGCPTQHQTDAINSLLEQQGGGRVATQRYVRTYIWKEEPFVSSVKSHPDKRTSASGSHWGHCFNDELLSCWRLFRIQQRTCNKMWSSAVQHKQKGNTLPRILRENAIIRQETKPHPSCKDRWQSFLHLSLGWPGMLSNG
jgi:hypothetical protein